MTKAKKRSGNCHETPLYFLTCVYSNDPLRKRTKIIISKLISHFNGNDKIIQIVYRNSPFSSCPQGSRKEFI